MWSKPADLNSSLMPRENAARLELGQTLVNDIRHRRAEAEELANRGGTRREAKRGGHWRGFGGGNHTAIVA
jgi:hypothetical protein